MSIETEIFKKYEVELNKLTKYGFIKDKSTYKCEKYFMNKSFLALIEINKSGNVQGKVIDMENQDEYLPLRIENNEGAYIGKVREEYIKILTDIRDNCFNEKYFVSKQGNRICKLIYDNYKDKPQFLWDDSPDCGVFKNPNNNKWYGIIMQVKREKLGEKSSELTEVMNVKLDKETIPELIKKDGYYPAYHMNKTYWITMSLDETLTDEEIFTRIKESHSYTEKSKRKS